MRLVGIGLGVALVSIAGCSDVGTEGGSPPEIYEAVLGHLAKELETAPLVHPRLLAIEDAEVGTGSGHLAEHYVSEAPMLRDLVASRGFKFCAVPDGDFACDGDVPVWVAFSEIRGSESESVVWVTQVERFDPPWISVTLYLARVSGDSGDLQVELVVLDRSN